MNNSIKYLSEHIILLFLIIPAFILTLLPLIFDGQTGCVNGTCGFIIGTNYRDGIWFQAVSATAFQTFPFQMPNFAGEVLRGYHYLPNLLTYLLSLVGIPIAVTFYKLIPIAFMIGLTALSISLARKIKDSPLFVALFLFFTYFGMHLSLVTSLYHFGEIRNSVLINTFQATRLLESPHAAIAMLILYSVLILLYRNKLRLRDHILISILVFLSFGIKFYVAFSLMTILFFNELFRLIQKRNFRKFLWHNSLYGLGALIAIFMFYDPLDSASSGSIFIFAPFATVHHLIESPDLFYNENMIHARYFLYEAGWSPRLLMIELLSVFLFVLFYFGTRILGFIYILRGIITKSLNTIETAVSVSIILSITIAVMFIQKGDWFNPIQFAVPASYLSTLFLSKLIYQVISWNKKTGYVILTMLVLLTFPANLANAAYLSNPGRFVIPQGEMDALDYLKNQPNGVVFAPMDENDMAYVSAFTRKPTYINFQNTLENAGIDFERRMEISTKEISSIPQEKEIQYIYIPLSHKDSVSLLLMCHGEYFEKVYENNEAVVCERL